MKTISNDFKALILICIFLIFCIMLTYAHHGDFLFDCGREAYYPVEILKGKILYKDIFNIYGPFSYMFNSALFKVFGVNLNVLYIAGCICAFCITYLIYSIARNFISCFVSFSISIFTIAVGVLSLNLFNYIFPYCYAMVYGLVAFLFSVFFLIKYSYSDEKIFYLYLSCFFAGIAVSNKYDFIFYPLVILYVFIQKKLFDYKKYLYALFSFLLVPLTCFLILFIQGLNIRDLISNVLIINSMLKNPLLKYFYTNIGVFFDVKILYVVFIEFIKFLLPLSLVIWLKNKVKGLFYFVVLLLYSLFVLFTFKLYSFIYLPLLITFLFIMDFKKNINNLSLSIVVLSAVSISCKVYFGALIYNYGSFYVSFLLVAFFALIFYKFINYKINFSIFGLYILIVSIFLANNVIFNLKIKSYLINTNKGKIYVNKSIGNASDKLLKYIKYNTKAKDIVIVLPEGAMINFIADRKSDNYYTSLIPLYVYTFGEKKIIKHFKELKPDYIVFNNSNMKRDHGFENICNDYAFELCNFVAQNYYYRKEIDTGFRYLIYQKK